MPEHISGRTALGELRREWRTLAGAIVGLSAGVTSTLGYSFGALVGPLEVAFGWSRAQLSLGLSLYAMALLLTGPIWGVAADRYGVRPVATSSLIAFGAMMMMMPHLLQFVPFWLLYFLAGVVGCGSTAVTLLKPLAMCFSVGRGIALGIALCSVSLAAFWVPHFTTWLAGRGDWALAYVGIAVIALSAAPVIWLLVPQSKEASGAKIATTGTPEAEGLSLANAFHTQDFWLVLLMGFTIAMGLSAMAIHLIPIFIEAGGSTVSAANTASILGLSSVVGRLVVGGILDRVKGPQCAIVVAAIGAIGVGLLLGGVPTGVPAVILIGLALGSEIDITAYFASRYFGRKAFSAIYGWIFGAHAVGSGIGLYLAGWLYDYSGNYKAAILVCAAMTAVAGLLSIKLGPYRYGS